MITNATTAISNKKSGALPKLNGSNGNGHRRGDGGGDKSGGGGGDDNQNRDEGQRDYTPERYRIGMLVALASIMMMFTALVIAYIIRAGTNDDWQTITLPKLLWVNTLLLVASSVTIEVARRALRLGQAEKYRLWLGVTTVLGATFIFSQLLVWRQLNEQGIYLSTNPHSSFFYLLTGAHALHLFGGIVALGVLAARAWRTQMNHRAEIKRRAVAGAVALYWHFMDGLWIFLFMMLFLWR